MLMVTEGKATLKLAGPIILGELVQMSLHLIDTAMVGAIGYRQIAAAALALAVINIPFVICIGLTISISQMVSMANGRRDAGKVSHYLYNGFCLCLLASLFIGCTLYFGSGIVYHLGQDAAVAAFAEPFLKLMAISLLPVTLFLSLKMFTDGLEFTRTAMIISVLAMPVNVFLNYLFIFGNFGFPRLELLGAGYGTLITRILMMITMLLVVFRAKVFRRYIQVSKRQWTLKWQTWRELLHIGIPSSMQITMEAGAFAVSGILAGVISPVAQAAHQIALIIASFTFMVSMGLAQAGSIRVSNAFGRSAWDKIYVIGRSTLIISLVYGCLCGIFFFSSRNFLPEIFNKNPEVISVAGVLLVFAAIFQIPDAIQAISSGLLRGIKDVKIPTVYIFISYWVIGIPVSCYLAFETSLGVKGIWLGLILGLSFSGTFLLRRFLRKTSL